jgi:signal peptidase II
VTFTFIVGVLVFILDQVTKLWVRVSFSSGESRPILNGIFHLTFITNRGSAFGLFQGGSVIFIFLSIFTVVTLVILAWRKRNKFSAPQRFALGLLLGGVCGNLADRLRFGAVIDFLDFRIWPVFNVADSCITIGVMMMSLYLLIRRHNAPGAF